MTSAELKFDLFLKSYHPSHRFVYKANPGNAGDGVIASATYDFFERNALTYVPYRADERYSADTDILCRSKTITIVLRFSGVPELCRINGILPPSGHIACCCWRGCGVPFRSADRKSVV